MRHRWALVLTCLLLVAGASESRVSRKGEFLVATSSIPDPRFAHTVILIIEDNDQGTVGLVINRPAGEIERADVFAQLGVEGDGQTGSITVFEGGPVFPDQLFAVHSSDVLLPESDTVTEGIAVTEVTRLMAAVGTGRGPARLKLILGYAGWAKGQLDDELTTGSWMLVPARASQVFSEQPDTLWQSIMDEFTMRM